MAGFKDAYFMKAMRVRTLIINEFQKAFNEYDILISPVTITTAPSFTDLEKFSPMDHYKMDLLTVGPNLAGIPHISVNIGSIKQLPVGMMIMANHLEENNIKEFITKSL